jgi:hypothetical protein
MKQFVQRRETLLAVLIFALAFALLYFGKPTYLPFKSFVESDVLAIVTSLFVVAVFMERSTEAILIPIRTPDRKKIEQELALVQDQAKADDVDRQEAILKKKQELGAYKMVTAKRALWISFGFGLLISLVGVRTLGGLVEPSALQSLDDIHLTLFSFVDIVLTGGVIAGGSAAIDKIGRKISENFKLTSATTSTS